MGRALISVSDKRGVVDFARGLQELGWDIVSTGGTARELRAAGVPVLEAAEVGGFPEILDGRVKTLQPAIHGAILARRDDPRHMEQLAEHSITPIDLVAVNLYPFRETVARPGVTLEEAIENIDVGGPTMVRAAAKNYRDVLVVVSPDRYGEVLDLLRQGDVPEERRFALALEAFRHTAAYDRAIADWLGARPEAAETAAGVGTTADPGDSASVLPHRLSLQFVKAQGLRYGENPHQAGAFYREDAPPPASIAAARQLHGKELSFNNINDADGALELVKEFGPPTAVAVKHTNPCGVASAATLADAYRLAHDADPVSIFGGIVALNRPCDGDTAREIAKIFVEIVIAPAFTDEAIAVLGRKKDLRLLATGAWTPRLLEDLSAAGAAVPAWDYKRVTGGLLVQERDVWKAAPSSWRVVTRLQPTEAQMKDLLFAWKVVKHVKSNAIVVARGQRTLGVGAGQMNRIDAARYALGRAAEQGRGAVLSSDAFFPFSDVVEAAGEAGIAAIIQPGGSIRDQ
ncbi:MAG: bifunctional phosphoribosylaminoimidazolecarboxamide formyltransferase/IMP cyclohydrolase, partial [Bacillota bacterium]